MRLMSILLRKLFLLAFVMYGSQVMSGNKSANTNDNYHADTIYFEKSSVNNTLENPGKGLYVNHWRNKDYSDIPHFINIIYQRFTWKDIEKKEGDLDLYKINKFIRNAKSRGYRPAFRVMSSSLGMGTITPEYVFLSGVPKVKHDVSKSVSTEYNTQYDPVYWNKIYLQKYTKFIIQLGKRLDGGKGIEFIDIGGIGIFGEMHLGLHVEGLWTEEELKEHGYSYEQYFSAYRDVIDAYVLSFPNTRVFLNISRYPMIADYAASKGVNLRFDGLHAYKNMFTKYKVSKSFLEHCSVKAKDKVSCMYEFALGKDPSELMATASLRKMNGEPVSYLHVNIGSAKNWSDEFKHLLAEYADAIGYNIRPVSMSIPSRFNINQAIRIEHQWVNTGMSAPESDMELIIDVVDVSNKIVFKKSNILEVSSWQINQQIMDNSTVVISDKLPAGEYAIRFGIMSKKYNTKPLNLKINKQPVDGMYKIFSFKLNDGVALTTSI